MNAWRRHAGEGFDSSPYIFFSFNTRSLNRYQENISFMVYCLRGLGRKPWVLYPSCIFNVNVWAFLETSFNSDKILEKSEGSEKAIRQGWAEGSESHQTVVGLRVVRAIRQWWAEGSESHQTVVGWGQRESSDSGGLRAAGAIRQWWAEGSESHQTVVGWG